MTDPMQDPELSEHRTGALARGLQLLIAVNDLDAATVSGLVKATGLPKATVIRLLQTLQAENYVAQNPTTLAYQVTPKAAGLSRALIGKNNSHEIIQIVLDRLADDIKWPSEYLVRDGLSMLIQANNRERAPIKLRLFERRRFSIVESAAGISYLAALDRVERQRWILELVKSHSNGSNLARRVEAAAEAGFAIRVLDELGSNMRAAAVSVPNDGGAISTLYFDDIVSEAIFFKIMLPRLKRAASSIADAIQGKYPE